MSRVEDIIDQAFEGRRHRFNHCMDCTHEWIALLEQKCPECGSQRIMFRDIAKEAMRRIGL